MSLSFIRWARTRWWIFLLLVSILSWIPLEGLEGRRHLIDPLRTIVVEGDYSVRSVSDVGAIDLQLPSKSGSRCFRIVLLGVDFEPTAPVVAWLRGQVEGRTVHVRFDRRRLTEDTRQLQAYVFVEDILVNEAIVRAGLAAEATHPSDSGAIMRRIKKAEQLARTEQLGIWSDSTRTSGLGPSELRLLAN